MLSLSEANSTPLTPTDGGIAQQDYVLILLNDDITVVFGLVLVFAYNPITRESYVLLEKFIQ